MDGWETQTQDETFAKLFRRIRLGRHEFTPLVQSRQALVYADCLPYVIGRASTRANHIAGWLSFPGLAWWIQSLEWVPTGLNDPGPERFFQKNPIVQFFYKSYNLYLKYLKSSIYIFYLI